METGTHTTLMRQRGLYAELFTMQADGYRSPIPSVDPTSPDAA